ncbi:MAG: hypothetical protein HRU24_13835 [Gammaproteobacteria bacterium]|nr:hypothetical protein [Gammaproteobacteria bacterium]
MLIFFGEQNTELECGTGQFYCPICDNVQAFVHHQVQSYFSLFFIKTFKLGLITDVVVCQQCHSCYDPNILTSPAKYQLAVDKAVLLRALCYILVGYGDTKHSRQRVVQLYFERSNLALSDSDITSDIAQIKSGNSATLPYLKANKTQLSHQAKQIIVLTCYQLAEQSCMMEHQDRVRINTIAAHLEIDLPEVEYLISSLSDDSINRRHDQLK